MDRIEDQTLGMFGGKAPQQILRPGPTGWHSGTFGYILARLWSEIKDANHIHIEYAGDTWYEGAIYCFGNDHVVCENRIGDQATNPDYGTLEVVSLVDAQRVWFVEI
jgi:hypothetical protein